MYFYTSIFCLKNSQIYKKTDMIKLCFRNAEIVNRVARLPWFLAKDQNTNMEKEQNLAKVHN